MEKFVVESTWTDKDSKIERFRSLYEKNDFITAYSQHTDLRVQDNPKGAIGRADEWETHGILQRGFLIAQGLKSDSRLLDLGCGTGRLARRIVPFLKMGQYTGADISQSALDHARQLAVDEGWDEFGPEFVLIDGTLDALKSVNRFDMIWAHSVFTHLPEDAIETIFASLGEVLSGKFLFTYKLGTNPERTGLKQWRYPFRFFEALAKRYGFTATALTTLWPASQRTGLITR